MSDAANLETPTLLLALPQVADPFFHKSVVLLLSHQAEGSLGFIVNRPTGVEISDILEDLEIPWLGQESSPAFFGGPVQPQVGTVLYRSTDPEPPESHNVVCPGIAWTQHSGELRKLAENPPAAFRLLLGYAGWGEGQLIEEILRNDWMTAPVDEDLIFHDHPEEVWRLAFESVGVDPSLLPSWTSDGRDFSAN